MQNGMGSLNFNHLRYFWAVAHEGSLTRTAERLNLSQSALSVQIQKLGRQIGHPLFDRVGKRLVLTEAGKIALDSSRPAMSYSARSQGHRPFAKS